jgi:hypothetical protein
MSVVTDVPQPLFDVILPPVAQPQLWRLSVEQYHAMVRHGILTEEHEVELLDGILVAKYWKRKSHGRFPVAPGAGGPFLPRSRSNLNLMPR